jgi:hypothetical protein
MYANLMTKKIVMTKTEAKAAGKPNTTEYNALLDLMKNFPGFQMEIVKSTAKKVDRFKGLNYDYMEDYIKSHNSELLEIFYELRGLDEDGKKVSMAASATYGEVKMWFLTQFPEIEKMGESVDKIIDAARKARADKKNAA